jgi:hypothetical protein
MVAVPLLSSPHLIMDKNDTIGAVAPMVCPIDYLEHSFFKIDMDH